MPLKRTRSHRDGEAARAERRQQKLARRSERHIDPTIEVPEQFPSIFGDHVPEEAQGIGRVLSRGGLLP